MKKVIKITESNLNKLIEDKLKGKNIFVPRDKERENSSEYKEAKEKEAIEVIVDDLNDVLLNYYPLDKEVIGDDDVDKYYDILGELAKLYYKSKIK